MSTLFIMRQSYKNEITDRKKIKNKTAVVEHTYRSCEWGWMFEGDRLPITRIRGGGAPDCVWGGQEPGGEAAD